VRHPPPRGFTLVEAMVVMALAGVVTLGIVGFYLNSQATWIDASSQAITQRDATLLVESLADRARGAASFWIQPSSGDTNQMVLLFDSGGVETSRFTWEAEDSLVHLWLAGDDKGPVITSVVERFQLVADATPSILHLQRLQVRASNGTRVTMQSTFALYNATQ
jgi:prepilin-type N-terminal cleavage/methylation domain-containing protein